MSDQAAARMPQTTIHRVVENMKVTRGRARQFWRAFDKSLVPMVTVDGERRYLAANAAARLVFRLSIEDWRRRRIEDLTPPHMIPALAGRWARLMRAGTVCDRYDCELPDGSEVTIAYCGLANVLPGQHLIVFVPAAWPDDELAALIDEVAPQRHGPLTRREREVLSLIAAGDNLQQVADELTISVPTVRTHARNALQKLGARNRAHAIALAMQHSLIDTPSETRSSD